MEHQAATVPGNGVHETPASAQITHVSRETARTPCAHTSGMGVALAEVTRSTQGRAIFRSDSYMRRRVIWLVTVVCLCLHVTVSAQSNTTGTISGRVTDQQGGVLPGVTVTATSPSLQGARTAITSEHGDFILPFLPPGEYGVTIELSGFTPFTTAVRVASTQTVPLSASLEVAGITDNVTVTAPLSNVAARTAAAATTVKQDVVDQLPLNRGLDATAALAPGVLRAGISSRASGLGVITIGGAPSY